MTNYRRAESLAPKASRLAGSQFVREFAEHS